MSAPAGKTAFDDVDTSYNPRGIQHSVDGNGRLPFNPFYSTSPSASSHRATSTLRPDRPNLPSKPTIAPPLQLTFGVEIECYLLYRPGYYRNHKFTTTSILEEELLGYKSRPNLGVRHHITNLPQDHGIPTSKP
jgi:hypothetical protein